MNNTTIMTNPYLKLFEEVTFHAAGLFALSIVVLGAVCLGAAVIDAPRAYQRHVKSTEELQSILRDECNMNYTFEQVERNGDNLVRICKG